MDDLISYKLLTIAILKGKDAKTLFKGGNFAQPSAKRKQKGEEYHEQ